MNNASGLNRLRLAAFAAVALLHLALLTFVTFRVETVVSPPKPVTGVMKLLDLREHVPPPPEKPPEAPRTNTRETIIETAIIETDEAPPPATDPMDYAETEQIEYLPPHRITRIPVLPEDEIRRATVYPPGAQRFNIEGIVYLELFIDRRGNVRNVRILRETPPGRGFGEAAINAFKGIRVKPAESDGVPVAVRYRYNISFTLR